MFLGSNLRFLDIFPYGNTPQRLREIISIISDRCADLRVLKWDELSHEECSPALSQLFAKHDGLRVLELPSLAEQILDHRPPSHVEMERRSSINLALYNPGTAVSPATTLRTNKLCYPSIVHGYSSPLHFDKNRDTRISMLYPRRYSAGRILRIST